MDLDVFVAQHRAEWARLDRLTRRRRTLSGTECDELVALYQRAASQLSELQSSGLDPALAARLSGQLARSRAAVSGAHASSWQAVARFATVSFPAAAYRARWWWLACAAGSLLVAFLVGREVATSPALQASVLPRALAQQLVRHDFRHYYSAYNGSSFAVEVWTHNATIAAQTVACALLLGLPIPYVLYSNASWGGIVGGLMTANGRAGEFWTFILPHGMLELSAVFLAAGAGLKLGWTVIDPGDRPRASALAREGRAMFAVALGLVAVLAASGAIEAFVTPSPLPAWARIGIGALAEAAFLTYVLVLGRRAVRAGQAGDVAEAPDEQLVAG